MSIRGKKENCRPIMVAFGLVLMFLVSSFINGTNAIFMAPVLEEFGCTKSQYTMWLTVFLITSGVVTPTIGRLFQKYDVRIIEVGASILAASVCIIRALSHSIYWWWASGVVLGIAFPCIVTLMLPTIANRWFVKRTGFIMSIIVMSQGLADSIFNTLGSVIIENYGWRTCEWVWAIGCLVIGIPASILFLRNKPEDMGLKPWGYNEISQGAVLAKNNDYENEIDASGMSYKEALKSPALWLIIVAVSFATVTSTTGYINIYCQDTGYTIVLAGIITSAMSIGKLVGQALLGTLSDFISAKTCFIISQCCVIVGIMGIAVFAGNASPIVIGIFAGLTGINSAVGNLLFPIMTKEVFGCREYPMIWAQVARWMSIIGSFAALIWAFVIDITGSYFIAFCLSSLLEVVPIIIVVSSKRQFNKAKDQWIRE